MANDPPITERTPLLQEQSESSRGSPAPIKNRVGRRKATAVYAATLGFIAILVLLVHAIRSSLPSALSEAAAADDFAGLHAFEEYLSKLTEPHPVNSREIINMQNWLVSVVEGFQAEAAERNVQIDVVANDSSSRVVAKANWFSENEHWFVESRNVIVRIHGTSNNLEEAILVNAHYDSVPTSYGVTDDGVGVAVGLELVRYFVHHPPSKTLIFLFNNFEEGGLIGAKAFVKHPWYKSVRLVINLEGAGAGGRAVLFRCSSLEAAKLMASKAKFAHATPLGNDMFKLGMIKSDTDYSIFVANGVPGLDIAFYYPRSHYHTPRDNLSYTSPESVQHMGHMTLAALRAIDADDEVLSKEHQHKMVLYDVLGRYVFAYDFNLHATIQTAALVLAPVLAAFWIVYASDRSNRLEALLRTSSRAAQGFTATFAALLFVIVSIAVASTALIFANPLFTYGNIYVAGIYIFTAGFLGLVLSQIACAESSLLGKRCETIDDGLYGLTAFWWVLLIAGIVLALKQIALLYFSIYLFAANALATSLYYGIPETNRLRVPVVFLTEILVPFLFLVDQMLLVMDSMRHSTADGTPEAAVYGLVALPITLLLLQLLPWVHAAGDKKFTAIVTAAALGVLFIICFFLPAFNAGWSPNKMIFGQVYNMSEPLATVSMTGAVTVSSVLHKVLPGNESSTIQCEPYKKYLTKCSYRTSMLPVHANKKDEVRAHVTEKQCSEGLCRTQGILTAQNSLLCRIRFDSPGDDSTTPITKAWVNGLESEEDVTVASMITYTLSHGDSVHWEVEYKQQNEARPRALVSCFYDEWTEGQIPAFTYLLDHLPSDTTMLIRGQGLASVNYAHLEL